MNMEKTDLVNSDGTADSCQKKMDGYLYSFTPR